MKKHIPYIIRLYKTWYNKRQWKITGLRICRSGFESQVAQSLTVESLSGLISLSQGPLPFIHPPCECEKKLRYVFVSLKVLGRRAVIFLSFSWIQSSVAEGLPLVQKWRRRVRVVNFLGKGYEVAKGKWELKAASWFNWKTWGTFLPQCAHSVGDGQILKAN